MDYAQLLQQVQAAAGLDRARAERVISATVVTLAERMSHHELVRLGAWLPDELQAVLRGPGGTHARGHTTSLHATPILAAQSRPSKTVDLPTAKLGRDSLRLSRSGGAIMSAWRRVFPGRAG